MYGITQEMFARTA